VAVLLGHPVGMQVLLLIKQLMLLEQVMQRLVQPYLVVLVHLQVYQQTCCLINLGLRLLPFCSIER